MPVADGRNVVATAQRFVPDLVIMDIQLPHVSGIDLIAQLKRESTLAEVPVLAVTAYAGKGDEERIRDAGAAVLLSTHALDTLEKIASRIVLMQGGEVSADVPISDLAAVRARLG